MQAPMHAIDWLSSCRSIQCKVLTSTVPSKVCWILAVLRAVCRAVGVGPSKPLSVSRHLDIAHLGPVTPTSLNSAATFSSFLFFSFTVNTGLLVSCCATPAGVVTLLPDAATEGTLEPVVAAAATLLGKPPGVYGNNNGNNDTCWTASRTCSAGCSESGTPPFAEKFMSGSKSGS